MARRVTTQGKLVAALKARGETEVKTLHNCIVMTRAGNSGSFYFIGSMGSLRYGRTRSSSLSAPHTASALIQEWEKSNGR